ncbi:MAG: hypothetical protein CMP67_01255 [Flavobacteriales bacterium]|nr:hypothetical protein [Flavobacteriales bacterium]|tara:strand:+ start:4010 stop:4684 length:675 start_codon:yes stop_codon:yes gene_type:complete
MRLFTSILLLLSFVGIRAQCESVTLKQEFETTQNIALVQAKKLHNDSIQVEIVKKWKGDSIGKYVKFELKKFNSEYLRLDTGKTYILFWFNGLSIDRCSRSSNFRYAHFEYELDLLYSKYKIENVLLYDSIQYRKKNIFEAGGQTFDVQKGKYAFYDVRTGNLKSFKDLPKDLSYRNRRKFYIIDKNVETAKQKYDVVFALVVDKKELQITKALKKRILSSLYK